jgi:hypothetical protein
MFIHFVCPRPNNARQQARPGRSTKSWPRDALEDASLVKFQAKNGGVFGLLLLIHLTGCDVVVPDDQYQLGPDSEIRLGVPQGAVRELTLPPSTVYPSYTHKAWLYIPAQYSRPDGVRQREHILISSETERQLAELREHLRHTPGVFLDERHRYSIRAFSYREKEPIGLLRSLLSSAHPASIGDGALAPIPTQVVNQLLVDLQLDRLSFYHSSTHML